MPPSGGRTGGRLASLTADPVRRLLVGAAILGLGGCASTVALDHALLAYDTTLTDAVSKQLLLNIARARYNEPMHFTTVSNVAATYKFSLGAGVSGALTGDRGGLVVPQIIGGAEENPTVSISPMQGDEFTQRLLTPFQEQKLTLLLRQGYDVDSLLRLMGAEVRLQAPGAKDVTVYHNRPGDPEDYAAFRRIVAHLSAIQDRQALNVEPLHFQVFWTVPEKDLTPEAYAATYKDFSLTYDAAGHVYHASRRVNGRVMISNYDPSVLSNDERVRLHAEADEAPANDILIDIRPGFTGGEFALHGRLRLRSFHEILTFLGRGIAEETEFDVPPDARTPTISENPVHTLEIVEARTLPPGAGLSVELHGLHYALKPQAGYQWNKKVFSLLYQLFQMSVFTGPDAGPQITIAK
jgi:hypothetical protein